MNGQSQALYSAGRGCVTAEDRGTSDVVPGSPVMPSAIPVRVPRRGTVSRADLPSGRPAVRAARFLLPILAIAAVSTAGGCATPLVRPWERDLLSEKTMSFEPLPMMDAVDDHIYFSKEGSTGGQNVGGGGCGCN